MALFRKPGVSVLLAAQNEEEMLALSAESFLDFGDEIIIVSNRSTDATVEIGRELAAQHRKIRFYDAPELPDLSHNRQFALQKSRYSWIFRGDADYVCREQVLELREQALGMRGRGPVVIKLRQVNLVGDFWHTGRESLEHIDSPLRTKFVPAMPPVSAPVPRLYRYYSGFEFTRLGRWEGVRLPANARKIEWPDLAWFHCTVKSDRFLFFRSERTNWRELGDFATYPTLESYVRQVCEVRYQTTNIEAAIERYMNELFYPSLQRYDPRKWVPYTPRLLHKMAQDPVYRIVYDDRRVVGRERVPGTSKLVS